MKKITSFALLLLPLIILLASCTSSTRITSEPPGATVYMNGQAIGETPLFYEDSKISFSKTDLVLKKEGYMDYQTTLVKDEDIDPGAIVGGIFFTWPFIWTFGYYPVHHYELQPLDYQDVEVKIPDAKAEQLQKLNEMYKEGIIDQEEFEILKERVLKENGD